MRVNAQAGAVVVAWCVVAGAARAQAPARGGEPVIKTGSTLLRSDGRATAADDAAVRQMVHGTGDVAATDLADPGTRIRPPQVGTRAELAAPDPDAPPAANADPAARDRALAEEAIGPALSLELERLRSCRGAVASRHHVATLAIAAGTIELRFTVDPDGSVANTAVVALTRTHPDLLECVQRRMADWRFVNGAGRSLYVERRYTFPSEPARRHETAAR